MKSKSLRGYRLTRSVVVLAALLLGCDEDDDVVVAPPQPSAPVAPVGLTATYFMGFETIFVDWYDASNNEDRFEIERATGGGSGFLKVADVLANVSDYLDAGLSVGPSYEYRVRAVNALGASAYSTSAQAQPSTFPLTVPDYVIWNLVSAYNRTAVVAYDGVLDENFVFYFAQSDVDQLGVPASWGRASEMASTTKMFTGQPGTTPGGQPQEPITGFQLTLTPDTPAWNDNVPSQYAGTLRRSYSAHLTVTFQGGGTVAVRGIEDFYVAPTTIGGETLYSLRYWVDFGVPGASTIGARAGGVGATARDVVGSWGSIKASY